VPNSNVLVVDDEYASTEVLALVLDEEGYRVTVAGNGRQALERLDEAAPDVIVTDYMMPIMNGAEMVRTIRAMPQYANVPVVLMSGVPEAMLSEHRPLYDRFLHKPFDIERLLEVLRALL
jgi:CheY-like chemotaxis protein